MWLEENTQYLPLYVKELLLQTQPDAWESEDPFQNALWKAEPQQTQAGLELKCPRLFLFFLIPSCLDKRLLVQRNGHLANLLEHILGRHVELVMQRVPQLRDAKMSKTAPADPPANRSTIFSYFQRVPE